MENLTVVVVKAVVVLVRITCNVVVFGYEKIFESMPKSKRASSGNVETVPVFCTEVDRTVLAELMYVDLCRFAKLPTDRFFFVPNRLVWDDWPEYLI